MSIALHGVEITLFKVSSNTHRILSIPPKMGAAKLWLVSDVDYMRDRNAQQALMCSMFARNLVFS